MFVDGRFRLLSVAFLAFSSCAAQASDVEQLAQTLIRDAGVGGGIVVHLDCGDGKLTTALHLNDSYLIQGLDAKHSAVAEPLPRIRVLNPEERIRRMPFAVPEMAYAERAPFALTHNDQAWCLIGTNRTDVFELHSGKSVLTDVDALDQKTWFRPVYGEIRRKYPEHYIPPGEMKEEYWRRIYYGINSAHVVRHPESGEPCVVGITHGENKNFRAASRGGYQEFWYDNTVLPPPGRPYQPYEYHLGGDVPEAKVDHVRKTYFGFVGLVWYSLKEELPTVHDLGPIVWPAAGYLDSEGNRTGNGIRHPSSIIQGEYLYVYYQNHSPVNEAGKERGLKVARAPLNRLFEDRAFRNYFDGDFLEHSLPEDFSKEEHRRFFACSGGLATTLRTGATAEVGRMHVAKVKDSPYFLGVIGRLRGGAYLFLSRDLVNWSQGVSVPGTDDRNVFRKPIPVNREYTNHHLIDPDDFYLVDSTKGQPCFRHIRIKLVTPSGDCRD